MREAESFSERDGSRRTFASRFTLPGDQETLRRLTEMLLQLSSQPAQQRPAPPLSPVQTDLQAAGQVLRYLEVFLRRVVASAPEGGEVREAGDLEAAEVAGRLAPRVSELAGLVEEAIEGLGL